MKAEQIVKWLPLIGTSAVNVGAGWVEAKCPLAPWRHRSGMDRNPSFGVKIMPGDSQVWCFSCHYGGTQRSLINELLVLKHEFVYAHALRPIAHADEDESVEDIEFTYEEARTTSKVEPWPEWYVDNFELAYEELNEIVHPYLAEREVSFEFAKTWDLRWDSHQYRVCFPIRDYHERLTGIHGRAISSKVEPRYRVYLHEGGSNPQVWLGEHLVDREQPLVITESVFDLARVWEVYENVLTPLRSGVNAEQLGRISWASQVICFFDNDEAGHMAHQRVRDGLGGKRNRVFSVWPPEGKDPGEMSEQDIAYLLHPYLGGE